MILNAIKYLAIFGVAFFPFALWRSFAFPLVFSHVVFIFTLIEILVLLYLLYSFERGEVVFKKSYVTLGLISYILILFITGLTGSDFGLSFWSSYIRSVGILTWLHYFSFFLILSSIFTSEDWKKLLRTLSVSGLLLAVVSFLGRDGFNLEAFRFLSQGGSFLGNTSYNGAYLLLIFFMSMVGISMESDKRWKGAYIASMLVMFFNPDLFSFSILSGKVSLLEGLKNPMAMVGIARTSALVLWAGTLLTAVLYIISKLKNSKKAVLTAGCLIILISAVYIYGFTALMSGSGKIYDFYVKNSGPMRPMVWEMAVQGIKDRPVLGWGDGNFKYVYQENLRTEIIHLENPPWFDRVHNFTLEELIGHGILGGAVLLVVFLLIIYASFKFYLRERKFYFLLIPFIFLLHFLQLQTFFQVDSTLFLTLILLAFLVSHQDFYSVKIPKPENVVGYQALSFVLVIMAFFYFVLHPIKENRLIPLIKGTKERSARMAHQQKLQDIAIDPADTLRQVSLKFMDETIIHAKEFQKAGLVENVAGEYRSYMDAFESHMPKYSGFYRYLFEYANLINSAFIFGIDELKKGEELARKSLEISQEYPYPYWVLAVNLHYQGRTEEAIMVAKEGYEVDPTIKVSKDIYDTLQERAKFKNSRQSFFYLPIN